MVCIQEMFCWCLQNFPCGSAFHSRKPVDAGRDLTSAKVLRVDREKKNLVRADPACFRHTEPEPGPTRVARSGAKKTLRARHSERKVTLRAGRKGTCKKGSQCSRVSPSTLTHASLHRRLAVWSTIARVLPRLCGHAHLFGDAHARPQCLPQRAVQHRLSHFGKGQTARELHKKVRISRISMCEPFLQHSTIRFTHSRASLDRFCSGTKSTHVKENAPLKQLSVCGSSRTCHVLKTA